ncbi:MAG TPA: hypothetical protein VF136_05630, partial [Methylomirabilota bacterium]
MAAALVSAVAAMQGAVWLGLADWRPFLVPVALCAAAGLWFVLRVHRDRRARLTLAGALAASAGIVLTAPLLGGYTPAIPGRVALALAGWSLVFGVVTAAGADPGESRLGRRLRSVPWSDPRLALGLVAVALAIAALRHWLMVGRFAVLQDEVLYLLQASWLTEPGFGWPLSREELALVRPEYTSWRDGILRTQYPPGWPALLAGFAGLGLRWWSTPILAALAVVVTWY